MKDIEYEKDGIKKMAQERFKEELEAVGWRVVKKDIDKPKVVKPKKKDK